MGHGQGNAQDGIRAEMGFIGSAVHFNHRIINCFLPGGIHTVQGGGDVFICIIDGFQDAA